MLAALGLTAAARHAPRSRPSGSARPSTTRRPRRRPRPLRRRLAWYLIGLGPGHRDLRSSIPDPESHLYLSARRPSDRASSAACSTGRSGSRQAVGLRLPPLPPPPLARRVASYPGRPAQRDRDGVHRRGDVPRLRPRLPDPGRHRSDGSAIIIQALIYALATRLGAPGRDRYMLVLVARHRPGLRLGDAQDRRHRRRFLGHAITRFAIFLATGHAGQPAPVGREDRGDREEAPDPRGLGDRRNVARVDRPEALTEAGPAEASGASSRRDRIDRGRPRAPPVGLYVHVPFCVSLCPYCDFVVVAGAEARGPREPDRRLRRRAADRARPAGRLPRRALRDSPVERPAGGRT